VQMNRGDPFFERDATGWQFIDVNSGRASMTFNLYNNATRTVAFDDKVGKPVDKTYQDEANRISPQIHY